MAETVAVYAVPHTPSFVAEVQVNGERSQTAQFFSKIRSHLQDAKPDVIVTVNNDQNPPADETDFQGTSLPTNTNIWNSATSDGHSTWAFVNNRQIAYFANYGVATPRVISLPSYVPPDGKDDRALKEALDLLRGTITDALK